MTTSEKRGLFSRIWGLLKLAMVTWVICSIILSGIKKGNGIGERFLGESNFAGGYLSDIINSVLRIPYSRAGFVINTPAHIKTLTQEEWMNITCPIDGWERYPDCIKFDVAGKTSKRNDITNKLCPNLGECESLTLVVDSYILNYPEVLWSAIKIAERPCDYIRTKFDRVITTEDLRDKDLMDPAVRQLYRESGRQWNAKDARSKLRCDKQFFLLDYFMDTVFPTNKFIIISVVNPQNKRLMKIVVRRQDID